jgi:uncharacterized membrane protein YeaQ/YmgE (transglycosylase-associated protein family)
MKKLLFGVTAGLIAGLLLPTEPRLKLSQLLAGVMGDMLGRMPDG